MEHILSDHDRAHLDQRIAEAEKRAGVQIVLAVIRRGDSYAELPWKAFALGASVSGLLVFTADLLVYQWNSQAMVLMAVAVTLTAGAAFALLTVLIPGFARLFLSAHRAETEVRQYAGSLFLNRELFATTGRNCVLLLVSLFERQVVLLPDRGLAGRLTAEAMDDIIGHMTGALGRKDVCGAMGAGLEDLSRVLAAFVKSGPAAGNEVPDEIIEEKGV